MKPGDQVTFPIQLHLRETPEGLLENHLVVQKDEIGIVLSQDVVRYQIGTIDKMVEILTSRGVRGWIHERNVDVVG